MYIHTFVQLVRLDAVAFYKAASTIGESTGERRSAVTAPIARQVAYFVFDPTVEYGRRGGGCSFVQTCMYIETRDLNDTCIAVVSVLSTQHQQYTQCPSWFILQ